jgi:hypothetical protein
MIERAGEAAGLPAARGMDTRRLQHFLGHAHEYCALHRDVAGAVQGCLALNFGVLSILQLNSMRAALDDSRCTLDYADFFHCATMICRIGF